MNTAEFVKWNFILIETEQILHETTKENSGKDLSNSHAYTNIINNKF
jgi:hypothetical protein